MKKEGNGLQNKRPHLLEVGYFSTISSWLLYFKSVLQEHTNEDRGDSVSDLKESKKYQTFLNKCSLSVT